ncbi:MAG: hypothetical protein WDO70_07915 [Alphaproteobacteria bacterium]
MSIKDQFKMAKREVTAPVNRKELFSMNINAASEKGEPMKEQKFVIDMIFKPIEPGLRLRPEETQVLIAYIGEILKEIEIEERRIEQEGATRPPTSRKTR